ncbi:hypothetical protein B5807_12008 [Epicoccum nigrum]|uniref:Cytochrome P450 n=1 Tax=Epicoccum nigrum TaxID=105696 RepID=A0A1Y2LI22_EPING|nr:hypothetical protein B5807_12008 [Epicoccum nigrum]
MGPILFAIVAILISPFLTYYVTSTLFFRTANNKTTSKRPPTVPYLLPGLFSAGGLARSGARKYFAELFKDYGSFSPFKVRAGLQSYVLLRDPIHISRVLDAPEHLTAKGVRAEALDKIFGSSTAAKHFAKDETFLQHDTTLAAATEEYISILSANMHDKMFQFDTWTRIEDLWSFLQLVLLRCTSETLFGPTLLKKYPRMVRDYLKFDAATDGYVHGMPRLMLSDASKPRNLLHAGLKEWSATAYSGTEMAGLETVRNHLRSSHSGDAKEVDSKAMVAEMLHIIHTTNSGLLSSTFWMAVESLRKSHLSRKMTATVRQHFSPITHKYDIAGLSQEPLMGSFQTEVHRLRTATCTVRINETNGFPLDKHWSLRKGDAVAMFSHDLSLNANVWKKAQPESLARPLEEFWAERFLTPNRKSRKVAPEEIFEPGGLGDLVTRLTKLDDYPGHGFIAALRMATIAVLFAEFEVQICDEDQLDAALPPVNELAFGTVKPLEKAAVRIRKRRT